MEKNGEFVPEKETTPQKKTQKEIYKPIEKKAGHITSVSGFFMDKDMQMGDEQSKLNIKHLGGSGGANRGGDAFKKEKN